MFEVIEGGSQTAAWDRDTMDDFDPILRPGSHFAGPMVVIEDRSLSLTEKRAILSSWASDACAVEAMPALRQVPGAPAPASFDQILDALQLLDREWTARAVGKPATASNDQAGGVYFS